MAQNRKDNYQDNEFVKDNEPFKDDLLDREKIANNWINSFLSNRYSKVIAVDADWGMGFFFFYILSIF